MKGMTAILIEVEEEVLRAVRKWPKWPGNLAEAMLKITEELGEAAEQINDINQQVSSRAEGIPLLRNELIQTAAMCVRMIDNLPEE